MFVACLKNRQALECFLPHMEIMTEDPDPYLPSPDPMARLPTKMLTGCHGEGLANAAADWQAFEPRAKRCNYRHSVGVQRTEDRLQTTRL